MKFKPALWLLLVFGLGLTPVLAQGQPVLEVVQRVSLASSATVQTPQDFLTVTLSTLREGSDPHSLQVQINSAVDLALLMARLDAKPGQMEIRTGQFGMTPRYGRDGKLTAWQGSAELALEGRDFALITATAGKLQSMTVANLSFGLTPEQLQEAQNKAQAQAIAKFRNNAAEVAKAFGFAGYSLLDVQVGANMPGPVLRQRMLAAPAMAADSAIATEGGMSQVTVTVSGSVQLK
jgi:predicted secreted protein